LKTLVIVLLQRYIMNIKNLIKSNICILGMIGGILLISSVFFMQLSEHW
jgi:hypothetical protein